MNRAGALHSVARLGLLLAWCCFTAPVHAQHGEQHHTDDAAERAQALFKRGVDLSHDERWAEARDAFRSSAKLDPRAGTYYHLAVASMELGLARAALDALAQFEQHADGKSRTDYMELVSDLRVRARARVGTLLLSIAPADARVEVDGQIETGSGERVVQLDPGTHSIKASAQGHTTTSLEVQINARATLHRRIELPAEGSGTAAPARAIDLRLHSDPAQGSQPDGGSTAAASDAGAAGRSRSLFAQPLTWIVIGTVVVAGVVTGVLIAMSGDSNDPDPYDGQTF